MTTATETLSVVIERDIPHPPEKSGAPDAAAFDLRVADEERLQAGGRPSL